ncbi:transposase-like protein [Robbsia andropogonis]
MGKPKGQSGLFDGRHFDREIIILCVRWYLATSSAGAIWWK